ncbi:flagellin [Haloarcula nitratireducens]|uniref:Flagellin n=1 Tax=Haloarcula nitratireducens TaxID=2487749 RepID=A0AAW4PCR4_9EURY|nr:flagellin [Halomicroarcula nitratireducens]MBX0295503.1 flagellin [Halomicroarcula nitratireducens]
MGFSVSGSAALVFVAMFIGFGMFYSATANGFENVNDARDAQADRTLEQQNTAIEVTSVVYNTTADSLNVTVTNAGSTELAVSDVDVLANNAYLTGYGTAVEGDETTDLWLPEERLVINATGIPSNPGRVKLVTGPGVSAVETTAEVS